MTDRDKTNPWLSIPASDYEGHMASPAVRQQQFLNGLFKEILGRFRPASVAVLGCSTGNGFEHIDTRITRDVTGVDINPEYLSILRTRFECSIPGLKLVCADIAACDLGPASFDLVHCALVLEYVDPRAVVDKVAVWLRDNGVLSVVLQLPSAGHSKVTPSDFPSLARLESAVHFVGPDELGALAAESGFSLVSDRVDVLRTGKSFYVGAYRLGTKQRA